MTRSAAGRTGRRPGDSGSRDAIVAAARDEFGALGYDGASVRSIARRAGVDPALVHHFFGGKEQVFVAAMAIPVDSAALAEQVMAGGTAGLGERLVRFYVGLWEDPEFRPALLAVVRSAASNERAAEMLREFVTAAVLGRVAAALDRPDPFLRATLVGSQLVGLVTFRYVIGIEPIASADIDTLAAAVGPTIQRYLTGDLDR